MTPAARRAGAALVLCALAPAAAAQRPHRTGLWGEFGAGPAYVRIACSTCAEVTTAPGASSYLRIGGLLSDRALLGLESFSFINETFGFAPDDTSIVAETVMVAAVVLWFPWRSGAFLKGGVGPAHGQFTAATTPTQADTSRGTGIGVTLGLGFDLPVSRKFALTANAAAFITAIGDFALPGRTVEDLIGTVYHATVGLTVR